MGSLIQYIDAIFTFSAIICLWYMYAIRLLPATKPFPPNWIWFEVERYRSYESMKFARLWRDPTYSEILVDNKCFILSTRNGFAFLNSFEYAEKKKLSCVLANRERIEFQALAEKCLLMSLYGKLVSGIVWVSFVSESLKKFSIAYFCCFCFFSGQQSSP